MEKKIRFAPRVLFSFLEFPASLHDPTLGPTSSSRCVPDHASARVSARPWSHATCINYVQRACTDTERERNGVYLPARSGAARRWKLPEVNLWSAQRAPLYAMLLYARTRCVREVRSATRTCLALYPFPFTAYVYTLLALRNARLALGIVPIIRAHVCKYLHTRKQYCVSMILAEKRDDAAKHITTFKIHDMCDKK